MSERYSILDLSKMVKIARENAILGLYEKALEKYKIAVPIIENRIKEVNEEIIKNKWKNLENCIKKELATILELVQTREVFKKVYVESEAKKANNVANVDFSYKDNNNNMDDKNARDAEDILKDINFVKNIANQAENKINNIQKKKTKKIIINQTMILIDMQTITITTTIKKKKKNIHHLKRIITIIIITTITIITTKTITFHLAGVVEEEE